MPEGTPLLLAVANSHLEVVKVLLDRGAHPNLSNNDGWTPLLSAADKGHLEVVKVLLDHGADVNATDDRGWASLHEAVNHGCLGLVHHFVTRGANINCQTELGQTPLLIAICKGNDELIDTLINHGADLVTIHCYGRSCSKWLRLLRPGTQEDWKLDQGLPNRAHYPRRCAIEANHTRSFNQTA